jgi:hypothetical protein
MSIITWGHQVESCGNDFSRFPFPVPEEKICPRSGKNFYVAIPKEKIFAPVPVKIFYAAVPEEKFLFPFP